MSIFWSGTTTRGAVAGGFAGLVSAVAMALLSPAVWVKTFGFESAIFPYDSPALFSMTIAFLGIVVVSKLDRSQAADAERAAYEAQFVRSETGIGAGTTAAAH
jgi:cation/acetate symporter